MKRCLICTKTSVYYGEYMIKNARDQGPGRNNQSCSFFMCSTTKLLGHKKTWFSQPEKNRVTVAVCARIRDTKLKIQVAAIEPESTEKTHKI